MVPLNKILLRSPKASSGFERVERFDYSMMDEMIYGVEENGKKRTQNTSDDWWATLHEFIRRQNQA